MLKSPNEEPLSLNRETYGLGLLYADSFRSAELAAAGFLISLSIELHKTLWVRTLEAMSLGIFVHLGCPSGEQRMPPAPAYSVLGEGPWSQALAGQGHLLVLRDRRRLQRAVYLDLRPCELPHY